MFMPPPQSSHGTLFADASFNPRQRVLAMQVIVAALLMGVLTFSGVALFIGLDAKPQGKIPVIAFVALGFAVVTLVVRTIVMGVSLRASLTMMARSRPVSEWTKYDLYGPFQIRLIIGAALAEGAAFFNVISYIIDHQLWTWGVVAVLLGLIAVNFPTVESVDYWAESKLQELQSASLNTSRDAAP